MNLNLGHTYMETVMKRNISLLISIIPQSKFTGNLLLYFILFVMICLVSLMLHSNFQYRTPYEIHDENAHAQNVFFQNNYSTLEFSSFLDLGDFRWIIKKTPEIYTNLTNVMATPLTQTVMSIYDNIGVSTFGKFEIFLYSEDNQQISMTGQDQQFVFNLIPGKRKYSLLVAGTYLIPYGRWPMSSAHYQNYGISSDTLGNKYPSINVIYRGSAMQHFATSNMIAIVLFLACIPYLIALGVSSTLHKWLPIGLYLIWVWRWVYEYIFNLPFSSEPVLYAIVAGVSIIILQWMVRASLIKPLTNMSVIVVALMSTMFYQFNVLPVSLWMEGVKFDTIPHLTDFVQFLGNLRVPMPIPLVSMEYLLYQIHNPLLFDLGYLTILPRIFLIVALYFATDELDELFPYSDIVRMGILLSFAASIPKIVLLNNQQNGILMYDSIIGISIVLFLKLSTKQILTPYEVLLLSFGIVLADMMRPFMMVITPIIVVWIGFSIYRSKSRSSLYLFLSPLLILLLWHGYHIFALEQLTWSNYSGYNLARAWHPEAMAGRPWDASALTTSINDEQRSRNSAFVLHKVLEWVRTNPLDALLRMPWLIWQTYKVPIAISRIRITGEIELIENILRWDSAIYTFLYRAVMFTSLWGMIIGFLRYFYTKKTILMIPFIVILIVSIVALTENGEQSRFLLSLAPAVLYAFIRCIYTYMAGTPNPNDIKLVADRVA